MDFEGNQIIEHKASQKEEGTEQLLLTPTPYQYRIIGAWWYCTTKFSNKKPFRIISSTFMAATAAMMLEKWQIHAILWANYDLVNLAATESNPNATESVCIRNRSRLCATSRVSRATFYTRGTLVGLSNTNTSRSNLWDIYACFMLVTSKHICSITGGIHILKMCVVFQIFFWRFQWFADYLLLLYLRH